MKDFSKSIKTFEEIKDKYPALDSDNFYCITLSEVVGGIVDQLKDEYSLTREQLKFMISQALLYNCVVDEIRGQINFLLNIE